MNYQTIHSLPAKIFYFDPPSNMAVVADTWRTWSCCRHAEKMPYSALQIHLDSQ